MKVLYAIQATGNGHISRARDIIPLLQEYCQCDVLLSGTQSDVAVGFPVKYRLRGMSFCFGNQGGVDLWSTVTTTNLFHLNREINQLKVEDYDFVINDFEPVSAWACRRKQVPCIALSHQGALLSNKIPVPDKGDLLGDFILKNYAPADYYFGFHFKAYDDQIFTPLIRNQVRQSKIDQQDYYTVYLPAYDDAYLIKKLRLFGDYDWHIFSKQVKRSYQMDHLWIHPIDNDHFVMDMAGSEGVLCGAGFETPAEALFLHKKLMVVPMNNQYEQHYNAAALATMGVPVIENFHPSSYEKISNWLESDESVTVHYPDQTKSILRRVLEVYVQKMILQNNKELILDVIKM